MMHDTAGMWGMSLAMWAIVILLLAVLVAVLILLVRAVAAPAADQGLRRPGPGHVAPPAVQDSTAGPTPRTPLPAESLSLLDPDERRIYEIVGERGGDVPQGDLVTLSGYSKAKVSRVLDRLEAKGLVVRLRRGMTNRVTLAP